MTRFAGLPRTVAFYLPQFHPIPENDEWWGEGFTEWTNVRRAESLFSGHGHPRKPGELSHYDLSDAPETMVRQVELARHAQVDAFCFYFYWFDGRRLLERPVEWYREFGPDFPYCLSWANEAWTRRWDGKDRDVLMPQTYEHNFAEQLFEDLLPHFAANAYLRVDDKPVFLVHRVTEIPNVREVVATWRSLARQAGLGNLYLIAAETQPGIDPRTFGFDAAAEFPPVGSNTARSALRRPVHGLREDFRGRLLSYQHMARRFIRRRRPRYVLHRGVTPGWDNTARRGRDATIYVGSSPDAYGSWLRSARMDEQQQRGGNGLVFINAWNEWAEGAYLEPDLSHGDAYLRATRWDFVPAGAECRVPRGRWTAAQVRSIALLLAGSFVARTRRIRGGLRRHVGRGTSRSGWS